MVDKICESEAVPCTAVNIAVQGTQLADSCSGGIGGMRVAVALGSSGGNGEGCGQLMWAGSMTGGGTMRG